MPKLDPVIQTIIAEALGEGPEGMRLVGETIVNRSEQRGLPPERVVTQPYQYTGYTNPGPAAVKAFNDPSVVSAAQAAWQLAQGAGDPTGGANHYLNPKTATDLSWMNKLTPTMTHGGHAFYTDRPGYQQKGLGPISVNPAQITPTTAALRQMTSPTNGNTALQTALNQYAAERATAIKNQVTPKIPAWVTTMNQQAPVQSGGLSAAQQAAAARAALMMNQSYAGQTGAGPQNVSGGALSAAQKAAANKAALSIGGNFSYAGQQGGVATPKSPSAFGAFPQGGQMPGANSSFNYGKDQSQLKPNAGLPNPFQVNQYAQPANIAPIPFDRPKFASIPNVGPKVAPVPFDRPIGVGTQLAVNPPKVAPIPFPKPNFGMGGPGFAPVNAAAMAQAQGKVAPQPMIPAWASTGMNQNLAPVAPPKPAVGTIYGIASNGGLMTQGYGGVNNSITQKNFAAAQGMQINPNGTMSLMAGGGPAYVNGVVTGGGNDRNPAAGGGGGYSGKYKTGRR